MRRKWLRSLRAYVPLLLIVLCGCVDLDMTLVVESDSAASRIRVLAPKWLCPELEQYFRSKRGVSWRSFTRGGFCIFEQEGETPLFWDSEGSRPDEYVEIGEGSVRFVVRPTWWENGEGIVGAVAAAWGGHYLTLRLTWKGRVLSRAQPVRLGGRLFEPQRAGGDTVVWAIPLDLFLLARTPVVFAAWSGGASANLRPHAELRIQLPKRSYEYEGLGLVCPTGDTVLLDGRGSYDVDGPHPRLLWRFSDGAASEGPKIVRTLPSSSGPWQVMLIAVDGFGASDTVRRTLLLHPDPEGLVQAARAVDHMAKTTRNVLIHDIRDNFVRLVSTARWFQQQCTGTQSMLRTREILGRSLSFLLDTVISEQIASIAPQLTQSLAEGSLLKIPVSAIPKISNIPTFRFLAYGGARWGQVMVSRMVGQGVSEAVGELSTALADEIWKGYQYGAIAQQNRMAVSQCVAALDSMRAVALGNLWRLSPQELARWRRDLALRTAATVALGVYFGRKAGTLSDIQGILQEVEATDRIKHFIWDITLDGVCATTYFLPLIPSLATRTAFGVGRSFMRFYEQVRAMELHCGLWVTALNVISDPGMLEPESFPSSVLSLVRFNAMDAFGRIASARPAPPLPQAAVIAQVLGDKLAVRVKNAPSDSTLFLLTVCDQVTHRFPGVLPIWPRHEQLYRFRLFVLEHREGGDDLKGLFSVGPKANMVHVDVLARRGREVYGLFSKTF